MRRLPFLPVFSEYHSVIVPMTISILLMVSASFRELARGWVFEAQGTSSAFVPVCAALLLYGWWIGVRPGTHSARTKSLPALGLFMTQLSFGAMLGWNGVQSGNTFSTILGGFMLLGSAYRAVLFRLKLIDFEQHFADIDLQPLGIAISLSLAVLVVVLTVPFGLGPLETVSISFLVADILTETRKDGLFEGSAEPAGV